MHSATGRDSPGPKWQSQSQYQQGHGLGLAGAAASSNGASDAEKYKLQVPGEISNRMSTILETSPFRHMPAKRKPAPPISPATSTTDSGQAAGGTAADHEELGPDNTVYAALRLSVTQLHCYQAHKVMRRSRNDVYALACGVCGVQDREKRWCCAWCAMRCCDGCLGRVKEAKGDVGEVLGKEAVEEILSRRTEAGDGGAGGLETGGAEFEFDWSKIE